MFNPKERKFNVDLNINYLFSKTNSMFEWENLPESIPSFELERILQKSGYAFITEVDGKLYALTGGLGGELDVYGNPTEIIISNPALKFYKTLSLERDGVLISNDSFKLGLLPIFSKFSYYLEENLLSMYLTGVQSRMRNIIGATDDKTKKSAELYIERIYEGELAVIGESALFEGVKNHGASIQQGMMNQLIEYHQYIKANLYEEIGLSIAHNMKRERLNVAEVNLAEDSLFPFVDNMMHNRLKGSEEINEFFGLQISVGYGSTWSRKDKARVDGIVENSNEEINEEISEEVEEISEEVSEEVEVENLSKDGNNLSEEVKEIVEEVLEVVESEVENEDEEVE